MTVCTDSKALNDEYQIGLDDYTKEQLWRINLAMPEAGTKRSGVNCYALAE